MAAIDTVINNAMAQLGVPYVFGAQSPGQAFDCSGLTRYAFGAAGVSLPHSAAGQQDLATPVQIPMPGDLVFWGDPAHHVAIYLGSDKIIAAPEPGSNVQIQQVYGNPTYGRISGLGTATAPLQNVGMSGLLGIDKIITKFLGKSRDLTIESITVILGITVIGLGIYLAVSKPIQSRAKNIIGLKG